jgi:hypothetical protein
MRGYDYDSRGRWIIIGGTVGATLGVGGHHLPIALALGVAVGMMIGHMLNIMGQSRRG